MVLRTFNTKREIEGRILETCLTFLEFDAEPFCVLETAMVVNISLFASRIFIP